MIWATYFKVINKLFHVSQRPNRSEVTTEVYLEFNKTTHATKTVGETPRLHTRHIARFRHHYITLVHETP